MKYCLLIAALFFASCENSTSSKIKPEIVSPLDTLTPFKNGVPSYADPAKYTIVKMGGTKYAVRMVGGTYYPERFESIYDAQQFINEEAKRSYDIYIKSEGTDF